MIDLLDREVYLYRGELLSDKEFARKNPNFNDFENANNGTIAHSILTAHNTVATQKGGELRIKFDALASHDITYVGIVQTAKASGLKEFPLPYVMTNCHNSLCAVGGTINEDDHIFGLSAAKKYGGIYVPAHLAVIHTYMRERMAGCGKMILGSDSHTRYGALGTMAIGEGGPELVKQLLGRTYDVKYPDVIAVYLKGKVRKGVGPQDVALAIIGATFKNGFVKNKVLEFVGDGVDNLPVEFRNGIDVMTTESACLSSIWKTDYKVYDYLANFGRANDYKELVPADVAKYSGAVVVDLDKVEPMIALPFHPSNVYKLSEVLLHPYEILSEAEEEANKHLAGSKVKLKLTDKIRNGKIFVGQGIIAGCAGGTFDNIVAASAILKGASTGNGAFSLSVYPGSQPVYLDLMKKGVMGELVKAGAIIKPAFCGPCFGAGDVPANNALSIRHTTRNFESREGSKPSGGQIASVALMDARSIAATAKNGGILTSAFDVGFEENDISFDYDSSIYEHRVYNGFNCADQKADLVYGPNIADWPIIAPIADNLVLKAAAVISDSVTTTDELIPSGETSSYRSNPFKLAEFTLSRKVPEYVGRAKKIAEDEKARIEGGVPSEYVEAIKVAGGIKGTWHIGSAVCAKKPGDGSAREQAASCQRVLGGAANFAVEYATKRYRSNLINWGMVPFTTTAEFEVGDIIIIPNIKKGLLSGATEFEGSIVRGGKAQKRIFSTGDLTNDERAILIAGCLINYYKQ